jgi:periplasmic divalent cation tolerance protein
LPGSETVARDDRAVNEAICEVVVTADDEGWLVDFTRALVRDRLVACGQHLTPVRSVYRWQGAIEESVETRVALHTRTSLVPAVIERTRTEHPYDVPCVIALPVAQADPAYRAWVLESTVPSR